MSNDGSNIDDGLSKITTLSVSDLEVSHKVDSIIKIYVNHQDSDTNDAGNSKSNRYVLAQGDLGWGREIEFDLLHHTNHQEGSFLELRLSKTGQSIVAPMNIETAEEFANAILRGCDFLKKLIDKDKDKDKDKKMPKLDKHSVDIDEYPYYIGCSKCDYMYYLTLEQMKYEINQESQDYELYFCSSIEYHWKWNKCKIPSTSCDGELKYYSTKDNKLIV